MHKGRRDFIRRALALGWSGPLLTLSHTAQAQIDPITAMTAAQATMSLLSVFSSGDNGLQAMLSGQAQYLRLIVDQLSQIQTKLSAVIVDIGELRDEIPEMLASAYARELIVEIAGCAQLYKTQLTVSETDPDTWNNEAIKSELALHLVSARQKRAVLSSVKQGRGADACMALPVCCAYEVAASLRLDYKPSFIKAILVDYETWLSRILGSEPGSLADEANAAARKHDSIIDKALGQVPDVYVDRVEESRYAKELSLGNFKIGANQSAVTAFHRCLVMATGVAMPPQPTRDHALLVLRGCRGCRGAVYQVLGRLSLVSNDVLGVNLLDYSESGPYVKTFNQLSYEAAAPADNTLCRLHTVVPAPTTEEAAIATAQSETYARFWNDDTTIFMTAMRKVNLQRAHLGYIFKAREVALSTLQTVRLAMQRY